MGCEGGKRVMGEGGCGWYVGSVGRGEVVLCFVVGLSGGMTRFEGVIDIEAEEEGEEESKDDDGGEGG